MLATRAEVDQSTHQSVHFLPLTIVVWDKFTIGHFCVKIVDDKIFSSTGVSKENFFSKELFLRSNYYNFVLLLTNVMHNYT